MKRDEIKAIIERDAAWFDLVPGHAEHDRRQLIALARELADTVLRLAEDAHVAEVEDRCTDCCPGCEAEELVEELNGTWTAEEVEHAKARAAEMAWMLSDEEKP